MSPDKQIFHCFGCGEGGDVIGFIKKIENISFKEAIETLAEKSNITLPALSNSDRDEKLQNLKSKVYQINGVIYIRTEHPQGKSEDAHVQCIVDIVKRYN